MHPKKEKVGDVVFVALDCACCHSQLNVLRYIKTTPCFNAAIIFANAVCYNTQGLIKRIITSTDLDVCNLACCSQTCYSLSAC